ncbi:Uncharacterized conserved protein YutE, UPF0331/DUF86 family [Oceanospirillum multiglobuliferum]|uniref:DUF86 domain-containing protein n=1 Tax=Oceanospirillum multiglobuliferum TaxID=64969 RepID=A0A1T4S8T4_9GAMM|nr:DUF86 domain-containing protein [Oceanospirillum multiglobuliferum]OPX54373.1 hypothetical protein BTE48_14625 [Oceanospirillum multiglobuliferum]SKA24710.1 Uncharacterized conserved protein YutE, UPF0331/DUF86 family [Oceanospirillum multiglobuliferum]
MEQEYVLAMQEQLQELSEELAELSELVLFGNISRIAYRATERNLQLLTEACIGIAKQRLKSLGVVLPNDARQTFNKLSALGCDASGIEWNKVIGLRNALVHDYLNIEPEIVLSILRSKQYQSLLDFAQQQLTAES